MNYASDSDLDDDLVETTALGQNASNEELKEALKKEQLRNQKLIELYRKLKGSQDEASTAPRKKGPKSNDVPVQLVDHVEHITRLGKKSAVMFAFWLPDEVFSKKRPKIDFKDAAQRYANPENQFMALVAELYEFVPEQYHAYLLGMPKFADIFKFGLSTCRSSVLYNLRGKSGSIFGLNEKYFRGEHSLRDCDEIRTLLGFNKQRNTYDTWPPILYPNNVRNMRMPFRNAALPLILKIAFHGAGALNSVSKGKPKTNAQLWNVTSVNEAAIAFAAIMGRFLLPTDTEIAMKGGSTGIMYQDEYWKYRKVLAKADDAARQDLIKFYNETVFPNNSRVPPKKKVEADEEEDLTDAIAAFNLGPESDDQLTDDVSGHINNGAVDISTRASAPGNLSPPTSSLSNLPLTTLEPRPQSSADAGFSTEEQNSVSGGENERPLNLDEHGNIVEPSTTSRAKTSAKAPGVSVNDDTATQRTVRTRKGVTKETVKERASGDGNGKRVKEKGGGKAVATRSNVMAVDNPTPAQKPISRRSNVVMSDEENENLDR